METQTLPSPLEYAPAPPLRRRRVRRVLLAGIVLGLIAVIIFKGQLILRRAQLVFWQYRCTTYLPSPQQVVFDTRPGSKSLPAGDPDVYSTAAAGTPISYVVPPGWEHLSALLNAGTAASTASKGTLYLGRRRSPAGHERLVVVEIVRYHNYTGCVAVSSHVFRLGSPLAEPAQCTPLTGLDLPMQVEPGLVFFAAQADPADQSRFLFQYDDSGQRITTEGRLKDDDTITFRDMPESAAAPAAKK